MSYVPVLAAGSTRQVLVVAADGSLSFENDVGQYAYGSVPLKAFVAGAARAVRVRDGLVYADRDRDSEIDSYFMRAAVNGGSASQVVFRLDEEFGTGGTPIGDFDYADGIIEVGEGGGSAEPGGGELLLTDEANGFAVDFTHSVDAERVAVKETLGPEVLTNGGFADASGWTLGSGWSIGGGVATHAAGSAGQVNQNISVTAGVSYRLTYTVTVVAGTFTPNLLGGTNVIGVARTVSGTYTEILTALTGNTQFSILGSSTADGTVDNVSLKPVAAVGTTTTTEYGLDSFFANAGTSPKQVYDSAGTLVWAPHNMVVQSDDISTTWTNTNSSETVNAITAGGVVFDKLHVDTVSSLHYVMQLVTVITGATYTFSCKAVAGEYTWIALSAEAQSAYFQLSGAGTVGTVTGVGASAIITALGNGVYQCTFTWVATTTGAVPKIYIATANGTVSFAGANTTDGLYVANIQVNRGSVPTAYLPTTTAARFGLAVDYDPATLAPLGLLCEPAATNLQLASNGIDGWGSKNFCVIAADNAIAPNGLMQADKVTDDGLGGVHAFAGVVHGVITVAATTVYTYSVYVKPSGSSIIKLQTGADDVSRAGEFDLTTGVFTATSGTPTGTTQALPNGWYRIAMTWTTGADTSITFSVGFPSITRDGTHSFWMWGAQLETGAFPSSPIPTFAASATRAADNYTFSLSQIPALGSECSMYSRFSTPNLTSQRCPVSVGSDSSNFFTLRVSGSSTAMQSVTTGGVSQLTSILGPMTANVAVNAAGRFKASDFAGSADGAAVVKVLSGTLPVVTTASFSGGSGIGASLAPFYIKQNMIVPRAWSDAELVARSTP